MSATAWGAVVDAIVAKMSARSGYRSSWTSGTGRAVFDSIDVGLVEDGASGTFLIVAWAGDPDEVTEAGRSGQVVATLGTARRRDEEGSVRCLAVDQRGDTGAGVTAASRAAALSVLDDVDAEIRADPTLGLVPAVFQSVTARIGGLPTIRPFAGAGVVTWVEFGIEFSARI